MNSTAIYSALATKLGSGCIYLPTLPLLDTLTEYAVFGPSSAPVTKQSESSPAPRAFVTCVADR